MSRTHPDVTGVVAEKDDSISELEAELGKIAYFIEPHAKFNADQIISAIGKLNSERDEYEQAAEAAESERDAAKDRIIELETAIKRYLADDFSCNGGAQRMFEAVIEGNHLEQGGISMIVDIITVNTPTEELEVKDFPEHSSVAECISIARDEHPDWTSMVVVLVRGNDKEGK